MWDSVACHAAQGQTDVGPGAAPRQLKGLEGNPTTGKGECYCDDMERGL